MNIKLKYCSNCNDFTPHKKHQFYDGITRLLFAFSTFGMSETILDDTEWECLKCLNK